MLFNPLSSASKWWIGGAAHIATHTVVFARLIIDGTDYGVHSFVVQVRNREGQLMPGELLHWNSHFILASTCDAVSNESELITTILSGVLIGDCGKKMGRDGIDNGWMQFNNVHIPRTEMLMKWAKVSREVRNALSLIQE